jgi:hypothetical protein
LVNYLIDAGGGAHSMSKKRGAEGRRRECYDDAPSFPVSEVAMTVFALPVFDATVIYDGKELFKGQGAASMWAEKLSGEIGSKVTVAKLGTGWVLCGNDDGVERQWGIHGQRLKRID